MDHQPQSGRYADAAHAVCNETLIINMNVEVTVSIGAIGWLSQTYHDCSGNLQAGPPQTWGWSPTSETTLWRSEEGAPRLQRSRRVRWRSGQVALRPQSGRLQRDDEGHLWSNPHKTLKGRAVHTSASFIPCWYDQGVVFTGLFFHTMNTQR